MCAATLGCAGSQSVDPRIVESESSLVIVDDANDELPIRIRFEVNSDVLRESSHPPLDALAGYLEERGDDTFIEVQGHADERGDEAYNRALSEQRAESVLDYLVANGVESSQLRARGLGSSRPAVQGTGEKAWSQNRRVEFIIID